VHLIGWWIDELRGVSIYVHGVDLTEERVFFQDENGEYGEVPLSVFEHVVDTERLTYVGRK